jgi:transposase-like protein
MLVTKGMQFPINVIMACIRWYPIRVAQGKVYIDLAAPSQSD